MGRREGGLSDREGGVSAGGRSETIWDHFAHASGVVKNRASGGDTCDSHPCCKDGVALLRGVNLSSYRYSIAWSRIQPTSAGPGHVVSTEIDPRHAVM